MVSLQIGRDPNFDMQFSTKEFGILIFRNWWFFLQAILHHYIAFAIVQPQLVGDYLDDSLRVMFSSDDKRYSRSFLDAFEFMFSDRRTRDSRQIWHIDPSKDDGKSKRYCFRKVIQEKAGRSRSVIWLSTNTLCF